MAYNHIHQFGGLEDCMANVMYLAYQASSVQLTYMAHVLQIPQGCSNLVKRILLLLGLSLNFFPVFICKCPQK
jgi:hypothetical protein